MNRDEPVARIASVLGVDDRIQGRVRRRRLELASAEQHGQTSLHRPPSPRPRLPASRAAWTGATRPGELEAAALACLRRELGLDV